MGKKTKTVLGGGLGCVALGVAAVALGLAALPWLAGGPVLDAVQEQANDSLDATVTIGAGGLHLWRTFPDAAIWLEDVSVVGVGPFEGQTLFAAESLAVEVDLMSALGDGPVRVRGLTLDTAQVTMLVDEEGRSNIDILPESADGADSEDSGGSEVWLRDLSITDLDLRYEDAEGGMAVVLTDLDLSGDADVEDDVLAMRTRTDIASLTVEQGGVRLLKEVKVGNDLDLRYAPDTGRMDFGDSSLDLNALAVAFSGAVEPREDGTWLDVDFASDAATFKSLLSLVPSAYTEDFDQVDADGSFTLSGSVDGLLPDEGEELPGFDLDLQVGKGRFAYPGLPSKVGGIVLSATAKHPGGDADLVVIDVPSFGLEVDGQSMKGKLALKTPVSDPWVDLTAKGGLDVGKLLSAFPQEGFDATGQMDVDVAVLGSASDFVEAKVDQVTAKGNVTLTDVVYTDDEYPLPFHIEDLDLALDPKSLDLTKFRVRFGDSDVSANGKIGNTLGWLFADQTLVGKFDIRSSFVDTSPFESEEEGAEGEDDGVYVMPDDLDLVLQLNMKRVKTADYDFEDVKGGATLKEGVLTLKRLRAKTLGGSAEIDGTYAAKTSKEAQVDMDVDVQSASIPEVVGTFTSVAQAVPLLRNADGKVGTSMKVQTKLGPDYSPDLLTLFSRGSFNTNGAKLTPAFLVPVAAFAGNEALKSMVVENKTSAFTIDGGKLSLEALPVKVGKAKGELRGKTGVADDSLDLVLDLALPADAVKGGDALAQLGAAGAEVGLQAKIGGTWDKPKVKVGLSQSMTDTARSLVEDKVDELVGDARSELVAEARAQGDKLVAEAEGARDALVAEAKKQGDKLVAEAKKQGKKLVKEAGGNPLAKAAAEKASDKLVSEAKKKRKNLIGAAEKQGDKLVRQAEDKRTALIAKAKGG